MLLTRSEPVLSNAIGERARRRARSIGDALLTTENRMQRGLAGSAGDALVHLGYVLADGDTRHEAAMHAAFKRAANDHSDDAAGLYNGMSGLRAAADLACDVEPRYAGLVARCDAFVERALPAAPATARYNAEYDLIAGWAGMRLARAVRGPRASDRLSDLIAWMTDEPSRWQCPHIIYLNDRSVHDVGLSHGITSLLAAVALSEHELDDRAARSVAAAAALLRSAMVERDDLPMWPHSIGWDELAHYPSAWCYGTPGVAPTLYAVARVLGDDELAAFALDAGVRCARRPSEDWQIRELGICHGLAGNALCFAALAGQADDASLRASAERVTVELLDALDANGGVCLTRETGDDHPATDEIKGLGGIALVLMTLAGDIPGTWMRLHGLAAL